MKLFARLILIFTLVTFSAQSVAYAGSNTQQITVTKGGASITVNGVALYFDLNKFPFVYQGTTYLPIRMIAEALGKNVALDSKTSTVTLSGNKDFEPDYSGFSSPHTYQDKISVQFIPLRIVNDDTPLLKEIKAIVYNNTTYLPMRALADAVGATLELDQKKSIVNINKPIQIPHVQTQSIQTDTPIRSVIDGGQGFLHSYADLAPAIVTYVNEDGKVNVGWDDQANGKINIATLDANLKPQDTISIKKEMPLFGTFTKDEQGHFYVLWGQEMKEDEKDKASIKISKYAETGEKMEDVSFASGAQYFNGTKEPFAFANAKLEYANGLLVAFFGRLMFQSDDGLNHQSSTALYVDTATMRQVALPIPYSSHSFDQDVAFDGDNIVFADRGDVYDRGFVITKINRAKNKKYSTTPFSFKSGAAIYQLTFSELGGIAIADNGYVLVGTSEKSMSAESAKEEHNESRNLFMQLIGRNFEQLDQPVLSVGETQKFNVSLRGSTYEASNAGVVWLTDYRNKDLENAAHPKVTKIDGNRLLITWEKFGYKNAESSYMEYRTTYYMVISSDGKTVKPATEIKGARMNSGDSIVYHDGAAYWAANTSQGVIVYKLTDMD